MGKLEKFVVLTVLFVVALILGVSLNAPDGVAAAESSEQLAAAEPEVEAEPARAPIQRRPAERSAPVTRSLPGEEPASEAGARPAPAEPVREGTAGDQPLSPAGLLSTARPQSTRGPAERETDTSGNGYLETMTGLAPSLSDEFMIYTWKDGDSFAALAERYFGSRLHVNRLLTNNEGLQDRDLRPGDQILVPARATEPATEVAAEWHGATTYTVQAGDVLGTISSTVYGTSKNWRKIYDANRDLLADPNRLEVGMVLRIPE